MNLVFGEGMKEMEVTTFPNPQYCTSLGIQFPFFFSIFITFDLNNIPCHWDSRRIPIEAATRRSRRIEKQAPADYAPQGSDAVVWGSAVGGSETKYA
jgi:hypothetical protein